MSELRKHPGMEVGVVPLWVSGAQVSSAHFDSQLPLSSRPHSMLGETSSYWIVLLPALLWISPLPLTVSKQAPSGRTGARDFTWERRVDTGTLSAWPHSPCGPRRSLCALPRLCFFLSNPTGQGLRPGSPHFHLGLLNHQFPICLSASVLQFSTPPTGPRLPVLAHTVTLCSPYPSLAWLTLLLPEVSSLTLPGGILSD